MRAFFLCLSKRELSDALAGVRRSDLSRIGFTAAAVATEEFVVFGNAESDVGIFMDLT